MKKQFLLLMVLLLPMVASAHDIAVNNADGKTIYYVWTNNYTELAVSYRGSYDGYYSNEYLGNVVIPESVTYKGNSYGVTSIGSCAFYDCSGLTSVTIPNSVTSIGDRAFYGCSCLTSVTIPNGVTSISTGVFSYCSGLASVTIPNSVTSIDNSAFYYCSGLTSVTIPNSVTSIGYEAFYECSGLTSVTIPNSVTSIGSSAFYNCSGLTSVTIPNSVISIGNSAFYGTPWYDSQPDGVIYIGKVLYNYKGTIPTGTNINIEEGTVSISPHAFYGCSGLTSVTIPNSVTSIGSSAFQNCSNLESLTIGTGVLTIGSGVFKNHQPAKVIWLTNTPPSGYSNAAGTVNYVANDQYTSLSNKTVYSFLSSMFEVGGVRYVPISPSERTCDAIDCLYDESAENINIGETVSYKGVQMTVKNVKPYTFYQNSYVKNVQLGLNGPVGDCAFYQCPSLEQVTANNVTDIGSYAFSSCTALQTALLQAKGNIGSSAFQGCKVLATVTLGEEVKGINDYAFGGCSALQSIVIPNSVTGIGQYAFSGCSSLNDVQIGSSVQTIQTYAFQNCSALPIIQIPQSVTSIGNYAFDGCTGIAKVIIDDNDGENNTTLSLGSNGSSPIFSPCPLDSVYIGRDITYNTTQNYGYSPFYRNTSLRAVKITNKETEISANEFYGCTNLQRVIIGDGVTTIGNWAFSGCSSLKFFAFGSQVQTIGQEAFSDCTSVVEISSKAHTPPVCGTQALDDINKWECQLFVPEGCLAVYQAADQWKDFFFAEEGEGTQGEGGGPGEGGEEGGKCATPTIHYANGELSFACETDGVTFCYSIAPPPYTESEADKVVLSTKYTVSVYARKDGYLPSEPATQVIDISGNKGLKGDVNEDGVVSITDAVSVVNIILNGGE